MFKRLQRKKKPPAANSRTQDLAKPAGHSREHEVDREDFGLKELTPGIDSTLDIIAIHGLNGHRERTWTAENGTNWLKDLLPDQIPNARVFTYGYDSRTHAFESLSEQLLYDHSTALVAELSLKRRATKTERRPIIFIAHSLGGIICKSALIHANMCNKSHLPAHKNIYLSTYGVLFFGTPHQGGNGVSLGTLLINVASSIAKTNTKLLQHLEMHSEFLLQQTAQYSSISSDFETKFFYEVYRTETPIGSIIVVPKYSAVILGAVNAEEIAINKDHRNMVRFGSIGDSGFEKVSQHLAIMAEEAPSRVEERWQQYYDGHAVGPSFSNRMSIEFPPVPTSNPTNVDETGILGNYQAGRFELG